MAGPSRTAYWSVGEDDDDERILYNPGLGQFTARPNATYPQPLIADQYPQAFQRYRLVGGALPPQAQQFSQQQYEAVSQATWSQSAVQPVPGFHQQHTQNMPQYFNNPSSYQQPISAGPSNLARTPFSPNTSHRTRGRRASSFAGPASHPDTSVSASSSANEMSNWGYHNADGTWSCAFPGCTSQTTFSRGCDLRKHYKRHTKTLFCRVEGCPQATEGGFSGENDRARHEAKHNPSIMCEWPGCSRLFSRLDNMKDHVRRVHQRGQA